jgi:hypothetical protein
MARDTQVALGAARASPVREEARAREEESPFASNFVTDKWVAFLASLLLPGFGQALSGSWSALPWFGVAVALAAGGQAADGHSPTVALLCWLSGLGLHFASAEHAKRRLEARSADSKLRYLRRTRCRRLSGRRIFLQIELDVPLAQSEAWRRVADVERFLCIDPFHTRVVVRGARPAAGVGLALEHRAFGARLWRVGRWLTWREGHGYAFSDLSRRNRQQGFPHVFFVDVAPLAAAGGVNAWSRVTMTVRGKWTAPIPSRVGMLWLRYVVAEHARLLGRAF